MGAYVTLRHSRTQDGKIHDHKIAIVQIISFYTYSPLDSTCLCLSHEYQIMIILGEIMSSNNTPCRPLSQIL